MKKLNSYKDLHNDVISEISTQGQDSAINFLFSDDLLTIFGHTDQAAIKKVRKIYKKARMN